MGKELDNSHDLKLEDIPKRKSDYNDEDEDDEEDEEKKEEE